jgi:hypothetical protein
MKALPALLLFLLSPCSISCQTKEIDPQEMIERMITSGVFFGVEEKRLDRMGDAAAVSVTKALTDKNPSTREIGTILDIIHVAFSAPRLIENLPDREPRTTQFVLQFLNLSHADPKLKQRIAEEKEFVLSQYLKAAKD